MPHRLFTALLFGLAAAACGCSGSVVSCDSDSDCAGSERCVSNGGVLFAARTCVPTDAISDAGPLVDGGLDAGTASDAGGSTDQGAFDGGSTDAGSTDAGFDFGDACGDVSPADLCEAAGATCGTINAPSCSTVAQIACGTCGTDAECVANDCVCNDGFALAGETCVDVDECVEEIDDCIDGQRCVNTRGSFMCTSCPDGFIEGPGNMCVDLDECATDTDNCDPLVTCTNTNGSFSCGPCPAGYTGDGVTCDDIDECNDGIDDCHTDAICTNNPGGFDCACSPGFEGDGVTTCTPVAPLLEQARRVGFTLDSDNFYETTFLSGDETKAILLPTAKSDTTGIPIEDVWVLAGFDFNGRVEASCSPFVPGSMRVRVEAPEFQNAVVASDGFSIDNQQTLLRVPITTVDPTRTFLAFNSEPNGTSDPRTAHARIRVTADELQVRKDRTGRRVRGSWFMVSTDSEHFTVQHETLTIGDGDTCQTLTLPTAVDPGRAFALYSWSTAEVDDSPSRSIAQCELTSGTTVECCRGRQSWWEVFLEIQVVEFADWTNGSVERGRATLSSDVTNVTLAAAVDPDYATPLSGAQGLTGASLVTDLTGEYAHAISVIDLSATEVTFERTVGLTSDSEVWWKVVTWPH